MPFLKPSRPVPSKEKAERCKRNGWRHEIYGCRSKEKLKDYYKGQWKNDKKEGKGWEYSRRGWIYEGDWVNDKKHGYGSLKKLLENGNVINVYHGQWANGKKHGYGSGWFSDGSYYEGEYCEGKRHGYGYIWYKDGSYYEGTWMNDRYHGGGLLIQGSRPPISSTYSIDYTSDIRSTL